MGRKRLLGTVGALALLAGGVGARSAGATSPAVVAADTVRPVAAGFKGPLNIAVTPERVMYVADAFGGELVRVNLRTGVKTVVVKGGVAGVSVHNGRIYVTATKEPEAGLGQGAATLARVRGGKLVTVADTLAHELKSNPDGQTAQTGKQADALSNPYAVLALAGRQFVADAGANDVLEVTAEGRIRTVVALPNINVGKCQGAPNNDAQHPGCDAVPTGVALGRDGQLYISGLGAGVAGRIWRVDPDTGQIGFVYGNLPPLTGIAAGSDGSIFASSLFADLIVRIGPDGSRTTAKVLKPTGLAWRNGVLYAASQTGQVFSVPPGAFS